MPCSLNSILVKEVQHSGRVVVVIMGVASLAERSDWRDAGEARIDGVDRQSTVDIT